MEVSPAVQPTLLSLPNEVLEEILFSPVLCVQDLCRTRQVCWHLHHIVQRLWTRVAARWKYWGSLSGSTHEEWYSLCCQRCRCEQQLSTTIDLLSRQCFKLHLVDEDELTVFSTLPEKGNFSQDILLCVLSDILHTLPQTANMTEKFYALYGKEHVIRQRLIGEWKELLALPEEEQTMERGAALVAQWMRPCHCLGGRSISRQLDSIAEMVAVELLNKRGEGEGQAEGGVLDPKRPRHESALMEVTKLKLPTDTLLTALNTVLYDHMGFRGAINNYYELENSYIDKVLERKTGIPITLSAVYEGVARRLGVHLVPVNAPRHFLLMLPKEFSMSDKVLVDAYSRGQRLSGEEFAERVSLPPHMLTTEIFTPASPVQVFLRYMANIYNVASSFNIERIFDKSSSQWLPIPLLSVLYLRLTLYPLMKQAHFNITEMISIFRELRYCPKLVLEVVGQLREGSAHQMGLSFNIFMTPLRQIEEHRRKMLLTVTAPKKRPLNLQYRVGMIMKHKRYDYLCVIYGWDDKCKMSDAWIAQMRVEQHPPGRNQPFYNVMANDGSNRYAGQANIMECPSEELGPIPHWEIGKFFTDFTGKSYIPNATLREAYPEDLVPQRVTS